ncbi:hypothetical protein [Urechidicola croceus]|uniref:Uncharacterized protein n=1 Tax=Urechidicola croceus TaxID=1850246 RepID=A0A1D8P9W6_9FLAO|nr:hypothetical protein [Urechidicola croceus]AOW21399.1 hypothetical protein LPB138_12235 [Urechidicola croceus]
MTKLISILFSSLILVQSFNISFEDLSKLNVLLEHADYHQETYGDSFFEFLSEHYGDEIAQHQNDHKEHEDLPFKHKHQTCAHVNTAFTFNKIYFEIGSQPILTIPSNFFYKESSSSFEKPSVFHPPLFT